MLPSGATKKILDLGTRSLEEALLTGRLTGPYGEAYGTDAGHFPKLSGRFSKWQRGGKPAGQCLRERLTGPYVNAHFVQTLLTDCIFMQIISVMLTHIYIYIYI